MLRPSRKRWVCVILLRPSRRRQAYVLCYNSIVIAEVISVLRPSHECWPVLRARLITVSRCSLKHRVYVILFYNPLVSAGLITVLRPTHEFQAYYCVTTQLWVPGLLPSYNPVVSPTLVTVLRHSRTCWVYVILCYDLVVSAGLITESRPSRERQVYYWVTTQSRVPGD